MNRYLDSVTKQRVINATAAGTSDVVSSVVDTEDADGVCFEVAMGSLTAGQVTKLKAQHGDKADGSDLADIQGSSTAAMADADSNKLLLLEVFRPQKRFVACVVDRGAQNAVIDSGVATIYRPRNMPTTQGSTVSQAKVIQNAPSGTA